MLARPGRVWLLCTLLLGCKAPMPDPLPPKREPVREGIELRVEHRSSPRPVQWFIVRIDLTSPQLRVQVTPSNGERWREVDGALTSAFAAAQGCTVAVNASPFAPVLQRIGGTKRVLGLAIANGERYSEPEHGYGALVFRGLRASIVEGPIDATALGHVDHALGGFFPLVVGGQIVTDEQTSPAGLHPRTAVGVTDEGRTLWVVVADGRQPGYSEGATLPELAAFMLDLGITDALNLDGGGSTSLVIDGAIVNSPIHGGRPGQERVVATNLCLIAPQAP